MTEDASVPGIDKAAVQARLGGLQRLGSRALLVTVGIAEATAALALIVPAETTSTSRLVLVVWNVLLLAALVFWRRTSDSMRRCFLYLVMSVMAVRWSVAWLGSDLTDTHIAVIATILQIPGVLLAFSMMHPRRPGLLIGACWLVLLGSLALIGSQRSAMDGAPLGDWRLAPLMLAMDLGLLVIVSWWVKEREEFVDATIHELELIDAAHLDPLTGLANRRAVHRYLEHHSASGAPAIIALVDLDHFKRINDTLGHDAGDATLQAVAGALQAAIRPTDLVGRWGGEEFIVWAHDLTDVQADDLVVRIRRVIATHVEGVTASIGWTVWRAESENWTEALGRADTALYEAKEAGRDRAVAG